MARRKQAQPRHLESAEELATSLQNGISSGSDSSDDEHVCGKCRAEFSTLSEFLHHKQECVSKRPVLLAIDVTKDGDLDDKLRSPCSDGGLPGLVSTQLFVSDDPRPHISDPKDAAQKSSLHPLMMQQIPDTNVTLEELHSTTVAVAQHGHIPQGAHLAALQNALCTLQQQQLVQLQVIQQLQAQILGSQSNPGVLRSVPLIGTAALTPPQSSDSTMGVAAPTSAQPSAPTSARTTTSHLQGSNVQSCEGQGDVALHEPNTLELLQRHTEQALQNTMAGGSFLLNGISGIGSSSDLSKIKKTKDGKPDEVAFKHRCRFCGKLFGSDSALQIHVRSHTGERPFKCNVCGNCFSTRGNLKVHFQRHRERMDMPNMKQEDKERDANKTPTNGQQPNGSGSLRTSELAEQSPVQNEQALDFSTSLHDRMSPARETGTPLRSHSISPNEMSNFSEDSADGSLGDDNPDNYGDLKGDGDQYDDDRASNSSAINDNIGEDDGDLPPDFPISTVPLSMIVTHPSFTSSPSFSPFFRPTSFSGTLSDTPLCLPPVTSAASASTNNEPLALTADPTLYQNLLPKAGSNDNSWESLMEITKTSETSKLQQLVDNIENKLSDPNQCIICHRVLSCKSALQMHYRTHTGERPFKCKICGRAFTTKGNLKTHMGVHRVKPPMRVLHQCPVCHKQFSNSVILQQHIRMHTGDPNSILQDQPLLSEGKPCTLLPPSYPRPMLMPPHLTSPGPLSLTNPTARVQEQSQILSNTETVIKATGLETITPPEPRISSPTQSATSCGSPPPITDDSAANQDLPDPSTAASPSSEVSLQDKPSVSDDSSPVNMVTSEHVSPSPERGIVAENSPTPNTNREQPPHPVSLPTTENLPIPVSGSLVQGQSIRLTESHLPTGPVPAKVPEETTPTTSRPLPLTLPENSIVVSLASDRPLPMTLASDCPLPMSLHCSERPLPPTSIPSCTSYAASLTALENHVKAINSSINHPLPFSPFGMGLSMGGYLRHESGSIFLGREKSPAYSPPTSKAGSDGSADERSTPGSHIKIESPNSVTATMINARSDSGALDLTPKTSVLQRHAPTDLKMFPPLAGLPFPAPPNRFNTTCRVCFKTFACQSALEIHYRSHTKERPFKCNVCERGFSTKGNMKQHMLTHKIRDLPSQLFSTSQQTNTPSSITPPASHVENTIEKSPKKSPEDLSKRPLTDSSTGLPLPKRPPGLPKHLCHVCNKPFSSGSALQIHMRTHTGDKPFKCSICSRAFTTKGNLKVHMGTHMWNNSTSRRGRRMSLDISPLPLGAGKPGEFPASRPDLYFPYLPPAFMNGMTPPKMNEISVIQTAGVSNGNVSSVSSVLTMTSPISHMTTSRPHMNATAPTMHESDMKPSRQEEEAQNQKSPSRAKDLTSPMHPMLSPAPPLIDRAASWGWKIACNVCSKICSSSAELEVHVKTHYKQEPQDCVSSPPVAENLAT